jgi:hypothetical protein
MTGSHHPTARRKAAAKADKLATTKADWQRIFDAEFAKLALSTRAKDAANPRVQITLHTSTPCSSPAISAPNTRPLHP